MSFRISQLPPPWFRCATCQRDRKGHDAAERLVPPHMRHDFQSVTDAKKKRDHAQTQTPLIGD